jgi:phage baseplate assembly protein W
MAVKLDFLQSELPITPPQIGEEYLYKDLMLDLTIDYTRSTQLLKELEVKDVKAIFEYDAVVRSLRNAFETLPGQKILNPTFGIDMRRYLFAPVSRRVAYVIGLDLLDTVPVMEPRVNVLNIEVIPQPDINEYIVNLTYNVPPLLKKDIDVKRLNLSLSKNGFQII